jgi:hypothetical protein
MRSQRLPNTAAAGMAILSAMNESCLRTMVRTGELEVISTKRATMARVPSENLFLHTQDVEFQLQ